MNFVVLKVAADYISVYCRTCRGALFYFYHVWICSDPFKLFLSFFYCPFVFKFDEPSRHVSRSLHAIRVAFDRADRDWAITTLSCHFRSSPVTLLYSRADRKLAASFLTLISTQMSDLSAVPNISLVCKAWVVTDPRYRDCVCVNISSYGSLKL